MSLRDCINVGEEGGAFEPGRAARARDLFDQLERENAHLGAAEAQRRAGAETVAAIAREAAERRRQTLLQIQATARVDNQIRGYRNSRGEPDAGAGLLALMERDQVASYSSLESRRKAVLGRLHGRMDEALQTFKRDIAGRTPRKALLKNMVREAFGEATGDQAARELARSWADAAEFGRLRFNAAGGTIGRRADWGLPQVHDSQAVRRASYQEWRDFIAARLDPAKMVDDLTGLPMTPQRLELALRDVYETVRTDGMNSLTPSGQPQGRKLANSRSDHRFLAFRDADAWLEYQARFGAADPWNMMLGHLEGMARDIARLEILGPNPDATFRYLTQVVRQDATMADAAALGGTGLEDRASRQVKLAEDMYAHFTRSVNMPVGGSVARGFAGLRAVLTSAQLGAAAISAIGDVAFQKIAAGFNGLNYGRQLGRFINQTFNPAATEDRRLAVRLGLIAEHWSSVALAHARYVGDIQAPEIAGRLSDAVLRASGLSHWTQAGRWAFGMEFMGTLADNIGKRLDELAPPLRNALNRYGIGTDAWDAIRTTPLYDHQGATFLRPEEIAARADLDPRLADDLAMRVLEMVQSETEFAVPSASLRGRATFISDLRPGTFAGEMMRSVAMYKNFAITLAMTHGRRGLNAGSVAAGATYLGGLVIGSTMAGAVALQLKEISKGKDPRPMWGEKGLEFWGAALMQGGGLGIFGDFLFSNVNRFGGSLAETLAGPVVAFFNDLRKLTIGNIVQLPGEDPTNAGREAVNFLKRYTPGGSIWYLRLAYERLIMDQLQQLVDPEAGERFRAIERRARREFDQEFYWRPGARAPDRMPDLEAAFGGQ